MAPRTKNLICFVGRVGWHKCVSVCGVGVLVCVCAHLDHVGLMSPGLFSTDSGIWVPKAPARPDIGGDKVFKLFGHTGLFGFDMHHVDMRLTVKQRKLCLVEIHRIYHLF